MTEMQQQIRFFNIGQYIKKLNFESMHHHYDAAKFEGQKSAVDFSLGTKKIQLSDNDYEIILQITSTSKIAEQELFKIELEYAGIFRLEGEIEESAKEEILLVNCVTLLFPFARREVAAISLGAGYQPIMLDPIDFRNVYMQYKQKLEIENVGKSNIA